MAEKNTKKDQSADFHPVRKSIAGVVICSILIAIVVYLSLTAGTRHGQEITVPDFSAMVVEDATRIAEEIGIKVDVTDSAYIKRMERGMIYRQNPVAGSKVKKGRKIHLTINAINAKIVAVPNVVGYSLRQAKTEILSKGLSLGRLYYIPDMATNNVLKQLYKNREVMPGEELESDEEIDLILGLNPNDNRTYIPRLYGMKWIQAGDLLHDGSLNIGKVTFDETVKDYGDSLDAVVFKQIPNPREASILIGSEVSIYLTLDQTKVPKPEASVEAVSEDVVITDID
ncbi:MAG: PASTA domain-containing protein [Bacteroidales bacterium]|nr:PASTA domain-containing protein [Bacteroidales bacterium]